LEQLQASTAADAAGLQDRLLQRRAVQHDTAALAAALCDAQSQRCQLLQSQPQQQHQQQQQQSLLLLHSSNARQQQQQSVLTERALAASVQRLNAATQWLHTLHTTRESAVGESDAELYNLVLATESAQVSSVAIEKHILACGSLRYTVCITWHAHCYIRLAYALNSVSLAVLRNNSTHV
jgi:hypothetical protein